MHPLVSDPNVFFWVIFGTVIVARAYLHGASLLRRKLGRNLVPHPSLRGVRIHHYVYGMVLCLIGLYIRSVGLIAIGFGLIADEVWFVVGLHGDDTRYLSRSSLIGSAVMLLIVFLFRNQLFALVTF